ncbi:MAG: Rap1a/Tai family immunity protein [Betaproteobacteria bacterium]
MKLGLIGEGFIAGFPAIAVHQLRGLQTARNSIRRRSSALRGMLMVAALIAGALLSAVPAGAGQWVQGRFTGEEMLAHCKAADKDPMHDFGRGICTGFIDGFAAGHYVAETWHAFHHRDEKKDDIFGHLCVPESTTRGQLARVFVQFLERYPEKLKLPAGLLLADALRESFPCPK